MKPRPETDYARRRRLITGRAAVPAITQPPGGWPAAPIRSDLAVRQTTANNRKPRQTTANPIPSHV